MYASNICMRSKIITIDRLNEYTRMFIGDIREYKDYLSISGNAVTLHDKDELIENLEVVESLWHFARYFAENLTLSDIYKLSSYTLINQPSGFAMIWDIIQYSNTNEFILNSSPINSDAEALQLHHRLKHILKIP